MKISFIHEQGKMLSSSWGWQPPYDWYRLFFVYPGYRHQWPEFTVKMKFD